MDGYSARYVEKQEAGDIIEIWLDLNDNFDLSFSKNGKNYRPAFVVPADKEYRFAVNVATGKVTILAFDIDNESSI